MITWNGKGVLKLGNKLIRNGESFDGSLLSDETKKRLSRYLIEDTKKVEQKKEAKNEARKGNHIPQEK